MQKRITFLKLLEFLYIVYQGLIEFIYDHLINFKNVRVSKRN